MHSLTHTHTTRKASSENPFDRKNGCDAALAKLLSDCMALNVNTPTRSSISKASGFASSSICYGQRRQSWVNVPRHQFVCAPGAWTLLPRQAKCTEILVYMYIGGHDVRCLDWSHASLVVAWFFMSKSWEWSCRPQMKCIVWMKLCFCNWVYMRRSFITTARVELCVVHHLKSCPSNAHPGVKLIFFECCTEFPFAA